MIYWLLLIQISRVKYRMQCMKILRKESEEGDRWRKGKWRGRQMTSWRMCFSGKSGKIEVGRAWWEGRKERPFRLVETCSVESLRMVEDIGFRIWRKKRIWRGRVELTVRNLSTILWDLNLHFLRNGQVLKTF